MELHEFIESGLIEMYCMGIASDEEAVLVAEFAATHPQVQSEIDKVNRVLRGYAASESKTPKQVLKEKIMNQIFLPNEAAQLPPKVKENRDVTFWMNFLQKYLTQLPAEREEIFSLNLPSNQTQITYAVWAKKGASVEESHDGEDEYLFMLNGSCNVICNGAQQVYHAGDLIFIPKNVLHKAISCSDDMLLIGQRIAA